MIITVDNGSAQPIGGIARQARVSVRGDIMTVSVSSDEMIALPRIGQPFELFGATWEFVKTTVRTRDLVTFTCRRIVGG